jgi:hypothetical protein
MSGHAAVSPGPTRTSDVPGDQPPDNAAVSALPPRSTAWPGVLVTDLVTSRGRDRRWPVGRREVRHREVTADYQSPWG